MPATVVPISHLYITMGLAFALALAAMICVTAIAIKITQARSAATGTRKAPNSAPAPQTQIPTVHASASGQTGAPSAYVSRQQAQRP